MKSFLKILVVSALGGVLTLGGYILFFENQEVREGSMGSSMPVSIPAVYESVKAEAAERTDFTTIAEKSIHAVVHVKNLSTASSRTNPLLEFFYGQSGSSERQVIGSGSGVIISSDGYIITNYHVIQGAKKLEVTSITSFKAIFCDVMEESIRLSSFFPTSISDSILLNFSPKD